MSVIVKGIDMPKSCDICPFMKTNDDLMSDDYRYMYCDFPCMGEFVTDYEASRHPDCPIVSIPPHNGPLVDLYDVTGLLERLRDRNVDNSDMVFILNLAIESVRRIKPVIEEEQ